MRMNYAMTSQTGAQALDGLYMAMPGTGYDGTIKEAQGPTKKYLPQPECGISTNLAVQPVALWFG